MKRLLILAPLMSLLCLFSNTTWANVGETRIVFKHRLQAHDNVEFYLKLYIGARIPMDQYQPDPNGNLVIVTGTIIFDVSELPKELVGKLVPEMEKVIAGEREAAGLIFDFSRAKTKIVTESATKVLVRKTVSPEDKDYRHLPPTPHRDEAFFAGSHTMMHQPGMMGWLHSDSYDQFHYPAPAPAPKPAVVELTPDQKRRQAEIDLATCAFMLSAHNTEGMTSH